MHLKCSLIISTYNWPKALELSVKSVWHQSVLPNEIIIADDGSGPETKAIIERLQAESPVPIIHVWHEDKGFRLASIRNRAMAKAQYPYLIQIDGDIILHPHFIKDHLNFAQPNFFVTGSRVMLGEAIAKRVIEQQQTTFGRVIPKSKNFFNNFRSKTIRNFLARRYKTSGKNTFYVKGCNMAFWRKDILAVNGYDETIVGWGREDSEIAIRLHNSGVHKKFLKMGGIQYHIYHPEAKRDREAENTRLLKVSIDEHRTRCAKGIEQYL